MPLTRKFRDEMRQRMEADPEFAEGVLQESMIAMIDGETQVGKAMLRDYVNVTIGFQELGRALDKSPSGLMRMLSKSGNPTVENFFAIVRAASGSRGSDIAVTVTKKPKKRPPKKRSGPKRKAVAAN